MVNRTTAIRLSLLKDGQKDSSNELQANAFLLGISILGPNLSLLTFIRNFQ